METSILSIIVPLYASCPARLRNWRVIANELSALAERRGDIEIIAAEHKHEHAVGYPHIRRVDVPVFTRSAARNAGWMAARSERLCFCDSDMLLEPDAWDRAIEESKDVDCFNPSAQFWKPGQWKTANRITEDYRYRFDKPLRGCGINPKRANLTGGIFFTTKTVMQSVGGWDERFQGWGYEDTALSIALRKLGVSIKTGTLVGRPIHLWHPNSKRRHGTSRVLAKHYRGANSQQKIRRGIVVAQLPKAISVCIAIKNRSRIEVDGKTLEPFRHCVESLAYASRSFDNIELIVADFHSDDWPLAEWIRTLATDRLTIKVISVDGSFSRGYGLNIAAHHATHDCLMFCDADMLVSQGAITRGLESVTAGESAFPVVAMQSQHGRIESYEKYGYGISFISRQVWNQARGFPAYQSWGGEDDRFQSKVSGITTVKRYEDPEIIHQWHPDELRQTNYSRPKRSDYKANHELVALPMLEFHAVHGCNLGCSQCSHYSNHITGGIVTVEQAAENFEAWRGRLNPGEVAILGGEPTLNPNLCRILAMARWTFPHSKRMLVSNGFFLHRHPDLPSTLIEHGYRLEISQHGTAPEYMEKFSKALDVVNEWRAKYPSLAIVVRKSHRGWMRQYLDGEDGRPTPYQSNPRAAYRACMQRTCTQLYETKLWKCPAIAYFPKLESKLKLQDMPEWQPFRDYQACEPTATDEELKGFLSRAEIPQCALCPSAREPHDHGNPLVIHQINVRQTST